jgi:hypothetical protein
MRNAFGPRIVSGDDLDHLAVDSGSLLGVVAARAVAHMRDSVPHSAPLKNPYGRSDEDPLACDFRAHRSADDHPWRAASARSAKNRALRGERRRVVSGKYCSTSVS